MRTAYLHVIDEEAVSKFLPLRRVGTWDGVLPEAPIEDTVRVGLGDGCSEAPAKGSMAAYIVIGGLQEAQDFEDGDYIPGTQHLPLAAFHSPMYSDVMPRLASVLLGYSRVVAHNFVNGKPGRPLTNVARVGVQVYDDGAWVAPGCMSPEVFMWDVAQAEGDTAEVEEPPREPEAVVEQDIPAIEEEEAEAEEEVPEEIMVAKKTSKQGKSPAELEPAFAG